MLKNQKTHWGDVAAWYDEMIGQDGSEYHQNVIFPTLLRQINSDKKGLQGKTILDIGCGQGVLCRQLADLGAKVDGIDYSQTMIDLASQRNENRSNCRYFVADATKLVDANNNLQPFLNQESYDYVTIVLSIQNMAYLTPVWQAVYKVLKPNGQLFVVMMHPSFRIPKNSDWQWNDKDKRQERVMWSYLTSQNIEITANPGQQANGKGSASTTHFHRPLQAYINTLGNQHLFVEHIDELVSHKKEQEGVKSLALDKARKEFPLFLVLQARKITL